VRQWWAKSIAKATSQIGIGVSHQRPLRHCRRAKTNAPKPDSTEETRPRSGKHKAPKYKVLPSHYGTHAPVMEVDLWSSLKCWDSISFLPCSYHPRLLPWNAKACDFAMPATRRSFLHQPKKHSVCRKRVRERELVLDDHVYRGVNGLIGNPDSLSQVVSRDLPHALGFRMCPLFPTDRRWPSDLLAFGYGLVSG
jgi:hypothetical protein